MSLPMVALSRNSSGDWTARKVIPADVRDAYKRAYGVAREAKFKAPAGTPKGELRALCADWLAGVERAIAALRAAANGTGRTLTKTEAAGLAGEWYRWYHAQHVDSKGPSHWRQLGDLFVWEILAPWGPEDFLEPEGARPTARYGAPPDPDAPPPPSSENRSEIRLAIATEARTEAFLASRGIVLSESALALFLDAVLHSLLLAFTQLERRASGNYSLDTNLETFPPFEPKQRPVGAGLSSWGLFEAYVTTRKPAKGTVDRHRSVLKKLQDDFPDTPADAITEAQARGWIGGLATAERSARTIRDIWLSASRTVFSWGVKQRLIRQNPFAAVHVDVPRQVQNRETKAFTPEEAQTILVASLALESPKRAFPRAQRWVPWLCAYSGARSGEITQLRGADVQKRGDFYVMKLVPEAGTIKTGKARTVPIHEHLIAQGFIEFVESVGDGPLFYNPKTDAPADEDPTNPTGTTASRTSAPGASGSPSTHRT